MIGLQKSGWLIKYEGRSIMKSLSVFCWNISNPSIERAEKQAVWLRKRPEDILVLTEAKHSKGCLFLENYFKSYGYNVIFPKPTDKDYAVMIVSKLAVRSTVFSERMSFLNSRLVSAEIDIFDQKIEIIGTYVPSRDVSEKKIIRKKTFLENLVKNFDKNPSNSERIFCGDLNILELNHVPHYSFFKSWEYDFYKKIQDYHLVDAFRQLNPTKQDYSWIGRTGDGYRYDHCFVSKGLVKKLTNSYYLHSPRDQKLSDHAAIITELSF
jgi:exodeoxyribonuclease-3